MPGTYVRDTNGPNLFAGSTLNAAGSTNGTAVECDAAGTDVTFVISTGTVTGTTPTLSVNIQAAENLAFDEGVVSLGQFPVSSGTGAAQSDLERSMTVHVPARKRFLRAGVTLGGTSPVYTGSTCVPSIKHYHRVYTTTAS